MDKAQILKRMFGMYPNAKVNPLMVATYAELLDDIPDIELDAAVKQVLAESEFLPTVAAVRNKWLEMKQAQKPDRMEADEAWGLVQKAIMQVGHWGMPTFQDERIIKVVGWMGWRNLCLSGDVMVDRAHFRQMYNSLLERERREDKLLPASRQFQQIVQDTANRLEDKKGERG